jgi:hypothetical protein
MTASQTTSAPYEVGYRKPPRHTQFQKGQSGNPGGRPRRPAKRLEELALYEAYRTTIVMEDGHAMPMPAIQAVLRRQLQIAAGGNVRAQRDILAMIRDIECIRSATGVFDGADDAVDDTDDADDADAIDANDNDDGADAGRDDAGGADDDEPARQQADGIDTLGERREAEPEPAAPPAVSAPQPENATAPPAGRTPSLPSGSGSGQRRGVLPHRRGPERGAGVKPARLQPGRRRSPAVNAGKIRQRHSGSSRRSPGRTNGGPGRAQAAGGHARAPAAPAERDEKLKIPCKFPVFRESASLHAGAWRDRPPHRAPNLGARPCPRPRRAT